MQHASARPAKRQRSESVPADGVILGADRYGVYISPSDVVVGRVGSAAARRVMLFNTYRALRALAAAHGFGFSVSSGTTCGDVAAAQQALITCADVQRDRAGGDFVDVETRQPVSREVAVDFFTTSALEHVHAAARTGCIPPDLLRTCLGALHTCRFVLLSGVTVRTALHYCRDLVSRFVDFAETFAAANAGGEHAEAPPFCVTVGRALRDLWRVLPTTHARVADGLTEGSERWYALPAWEQELRLLDATFASAHEALHAHLSKTSAAARAADAAAAA
jgi:hypothetical protein